MILAVSRALLAVPGHYAFGVLMGYYYSVYHFSDKSILNWLLIFLAPVITHGIYDTLVMSGAVDPIVGVICAFALTFFCVRMHKFAYKKVMTQIERDYNDTRVV